MPITDDWRNIEHVNAATLTRERWTFSAVGDRIRAHSCTIETFAGGTWRETTQWADTSTKDAPPLSASVRDEVLRRFRDAVTVVEPETER